MAKIEKKNGFINYKKVTIYTNCLLLPTEEGSF